MLLYADEHGTFVADPPPTTVIQVALAEAKELLPGSHALPEAAAAGLEERPREATPSTSGSQRAVAEVESSAPDCSGCIWNAAMLQFCMGCVVGALATATLPRLMARPRSRGFSPSPKQSV